MTLSMAQFEPGQFVLHPGQPGWGIGQVQSALGDRVTVNFAEAGKQTINTSVIALELADDAPPPSSIASP